MRVSTADWLGDGVGVKQDININLPDALSSDAYPLIRVCTMKLAALTGDPHT